MGRKVHANHGRDHRPNGPDPIPGGAGGISWYLTSGFEDNETGSATFESSRTVTFGANSSTDQYTNDESFWTYDATGTGRLQIDTAGFYGFYLTGYMLVTDAADLPADIFLYVVTVGNTEPLIGTLNGNPWDGAAMWADKTNPAALTLSTQTPFYFWRTLPQFSALRPIREADVGTQFQPYIKTSDGAGNWTVQVVFQVVRFGDLTADAYTTISP